MELGDRPKVKCGGPDVFSSTLQTQPYGWENGCPEVYLHGEWGCPGHLRIGWLCRRARTDRMQLMRQFIRLPKRQGHLGQVAAGRLDQTFLKHSTGFPICTKDVSYQGYGHPSHRCHKPEMALEVEYSVFNPLQVTISTLGA